MSVLSVPIVTVVTGEGGSGGALAIGVCDRLLMLQYSTYSVISPEGCASILWKSQDKKEAAAEALNLTADRLSKLELVDEVIEEPLGGAHRDPAAMAASLKAALLKHLERSSRFRAMSCAPRARAGSPPSGSSVRARSRSRGAFGPDWLRRAPRAAAARIPRRCDLRRPERRASIPPRCSPHSPRLVATALRLRALHINHGLHPNAKRLERALPQACAPARRSVASARGEDARASAAPRWKRRRGLHATAASRSSCAAAKRCSRRTRRTTSWRRCCCSSSAAAVCRGSPPCRPLRRSAPARSRARCSAARACSSRPGCAHAGSPGSRTTRTSMSASIATTCGAVCCRRCASAGPGAAAAVARSARHAAEAQRLLATLARVDLERASDGAALSVKALRSLPAGSAAQCAAAVDREHRAHAARRAAAGGDRGAAHRCARRCESAGRVGNGDRPPGHRRHAARGPAVARRSCAPVLDSASGGGGAGLGMAAVLPLRAAGRRRSGADARAAWAHRPRCAAAAARRHLAPRRRAVARAARRTAPRTQEFAAGSSCTARAARRACRWFSRTAH